MALKNKDFIEIEYTGRLKENNLVFDTTEEKIAKEAGIYDQKTKYSPVKICIGEGHVVKGVEERLIGKEIGEHKFELKPEEAFGKKDAKLIQLVPTKKFIDNKIQPVPGLQINIDGVMGTVKTVSGGRTIVDFNHPLSGKEITYELKINRIISDLNEKAKITLDWFGLGDSKQELKEKELTIKTKEEIPKEIKEQLEKKIKEILELNKVEIIKE